MQVGVLQHRVKIDIAQQLIVRRRLTKATELTGHQHFTQAFPVMVMTKTLHAHVIEMLDRRAAQAALAQVEQQNLIIA